MKKVLLAVVMLVLVSVAGAAPVLFEAYQEGTITIPGDKIDTVMVVELSFSVDTSCYVLFTAGGLADLAKMFLYADGTILFPTAIIEEYTASSVHIVYTYPLNPGEHSIQLKMTNHEPGAYAKCHNAYLQALIFLPDTATNAIAEQPLETRGLSPLPASIVSQGPYVNVAGASELVDATGRVIENAIEDDKVYLSNLSTGTYFARNEDRTIVKIVKVD